MSRLPSWFLQEVPDNDAIARMEYLRCVQVRTVCKEAHCPNVARCFKNRQLTFMILGDTCTRNCVFCAVGKSDHALPLPDPQEPGRIAECARQWGLRYTVVTSVTRDDLEDGGAGHFAAVIGAIHCLDADIKVEVLIPDLMGRQTAIEKIVRAKPHVFGHNIETVQRLYPAVRPGADYRRSLGVLKSAKAFDPGIVTKSSIMLGLGENEYDVYAAMEHLRRADVDILTLGQYLAPSIAHYPVQEFIHPEQFIRYQEIAKQFGFKAVFAGPLVRSSFCAGELYHSMTC
ncbi:MAG TPA: lipoyl synthase [Candidatus Omnitrophota bacterium]|nr:lipoyl synthase [Candidatus Omnitrophota bacterium]